jgi:hypothetical protein
MILEFRSSAARSAAATAGDAGAAKIIIFPGVRRERQPEEARPRRREKPRPKRDRLELPD